MNLPVVADPVDRDVVFIRTYLGNGDAVDAMRVAGLLEKNLPVALQAQRQLERPEIALAIRASQYSKNEPIRPAPKDRDDAAARAQYLIDKMIDGADLKGAVVASRYQSELQGHLDKNVTITHKHDVKLLSDAELEKIASGAIVDAEFIEVPPIESVLD